MARTRKNISLEDDVLEKGQAKANKMFAGNFSIYLTYLINKDCKDIEDLIPSCKNEIKSSNKHINSEDKEQCSDKNIKPLEGEVKYELDSIIDM